MATYLFTLLRMSVNAAFIRPFAAVTAILLMLANNLLFYITFLIYFHNFSSLEGWGSEDLALLIGCTCWAFGLAVFVTGGVRDLAQSIASGALDSYLGRPRHPLPALLLGQCIPSGLGDMASGVNRVEYQIQRLDAGGSIAGYFWNGSAWVTGVKSVDGGAPTL